MLVGTMDRGVVTMDTRTGRMRSMSASLPTLLATNITFVLPDSSGRLWVGTYGEGLYLVDGTSVVHYTSGAGSIPDDWVMCGVESLRALYFGTFGGGVAVREMSGEWSALTLRDGLPSMDVMAASYSRGMLYFGTLGAGVAAYEEEP